MPSLFGRQSSKKDKRIPTGSAAKTTFHVASRTKTLGSLNAGVGSTGNGSPGGATGAGEFGALMKAQSAKTLPAKPSLPTMPLTPPDSPTSFASITAPAPLLPPKYTFLPTSIPPRTSSDNSIDSFSYSSDDITGLRPYGFLGGVGSKVVLGLQDAGAAIKVVGDEIIRRALTTPLLFSNQALELSQVRTKMLISAFLETLSETGTSSVSRTQQFKQDLRFAREHELAWLLRWILSRITRVREGTHALSHGIIEWEVYEEWRGRERSAAYPPDAFPFLATLLPADAYTAVIGPLFHLLARLAAHSHLSGLTPHTIASLFAALLFDVPGHAPALVAHATFVRAASATEHLLLAFIRSTASSAELGLGDLPARLRGWVRGYPSMIASDADLARPSPRKGAKVVRCERASRTVRAYTKDLVAGAEPWLGEARWDAFERIVVPQKRGEGSRPKFAAGYRKRMCVKETPGPLVGGGMGSTEYGLARLSSAPASAVAGKEENGRVGGKEDEGIWGSLAGKEWSLFEEGGFGLPQGEDEMEQRLRFDLNESAKQTIASRRKTVDWTEFASPSGGFNRTDPLLAISLGLSEPVKQEITEWPAHQSELHKRLHKAQKDAVPFHHDTSIRCGPAAGEVGGAGKVDDQGRVYLEETFVDVWADLMMGAGWVDRGEMSFREANWAIVEYKAKPRHAQDIHPRDDPRTEDLYFLFEERVPLEEYQLAISAPAQKSRWGLFTPRRKRTPESPGTGGGKPMSTGIPPSDFDRMLLHRSATKRITLSNPNGATVWHLAPPPDSEPPSSRPVKSAYTGGAGTNGSGTASRTKEGREKPTLGATMTMSESKSSFFAPKPLGIGRSLRRIKTSEDVKEGWKGEKAHEVDFEMASASGVSSGDNSPNDGMAKATKAKRGEDDKWMDILIANGARRMDRQDAHPPILSSRPALPPPARQGGLPVSPHPPARRASPQPPHSLAIARLTPPALDAPESRDEVARGISRGYDHIDPYAPYDDPAPQLPDTEDGTPRGVRFNRSSDHMYMREKDMPPTPHDEISERGRGSMEYAYGSEEGHGTTEEAYRASFEESLWDHQHRTVRRVSPGRGRDTIHGIVDTYRDSSSTPLPDTHGDDDADAEERERDFSPRRRGRDSTVSTNSNLSSEGGRERHSLELARTRSNEPSAGPVSVSTGTMAGHAQHSLAPEDVEILVPPGPIFDLTPGREPSPARYKHGEPLHFVGEEEEEEEPQPAPPPRRRWA